MKIYDLLNAKPNAVIGYLGGSITNGSAASSPTKCYRSLVTKNLRKDFPNLKEINAGLGGTGSDLGIYRMDSDLLIHNPDIVFVEFAVNDYENKDTAYYMEFTVKKILRKNPDCAICFLFTMNQKMYEEYLRNKIPQSVKMQQHVAEHYNIPYINVGKSLFDLIMRNSEKFEKYFYDDTHPNDAGHKFYAEIISDKIKEFNFHISGKTLPITSALPSYTLMVPAADYLENKWRVSAGNMLKKFPNYIYSNEKDAKITFKFTGTEIGVFYTMEKDSGIFEYSVDNDAFKKISTWDEFSPDFSRCSYSILKHNMDNKPHTLTIRVCGEHSDLSEGDYIRIGAFLVSK